MLSSVHLRRCDDAFPLSPPMDPFVVSADQVKLKFSGLCFDFFFFFFFLRYIAMAMAWHSVSGYFLESEAL